MSRLAKAFGLSDVGLRKICVKHDIPTPPAGYWAKVAHGKPVRQVPLPPLRTGGAHHIYITARSGPAMPPTVVAAQEAARAQEAETSAIIVPEERPSRLHPIAAATGKAVRAAKADFEGFKHGKGSDCVDTEIGASSIERARRIIDAFARAVEDRGHTLAESNEGVQIVVDGVPFSWRIYEIKDRTPHQPTRKELKEQARLEENRLRWPSLYSSDSKTKAYRSWDHYPSGRLAMIFGDATLPRWSRARAVGRWQDRKSKRLEEYLGDAMGTLAMAAVAIKHRLAEDVEQERRRTEEIERQRREQERRERALNRREFLFKKADEYDRYKKLAAFAAHMELEVYEHSGDADDRLVRELRSLVDTLHNGLHRDALQEEAVSLKLYADDDPVSDPSEN